MAFDTLQGKTPTYIKAVQIILTRELEDPTDPLTMIERVRYKVVPADQNVNDMNPVSGNLVPRLTAPQISALQSFMDDMWADAVAALT